MPIRFAVDAGIATMTLERPEKLNALDASMRAAVRDAWARIATDPDIDVAIVTGAGERAFCTGADLKDAPADASFAAEVFGAGVDGSVTAGIEMDKPLICAINGMALGGGLEICLACDIRIATTNATFGLPEVRVGTIPGSGGTQRLPRLIGSSDAMLMLLAGETIDAAEALRLGLVSRVVEPAALQPTARAIAARIAANAPLAVRAVKRLVRQWRDLPLDRALEAERHAWGLLRDSEDRREGRAAFAERRPPRFKRR
ncbi:MAG TPA: enoyl-CoA hydratase-related protein [Burkholderiales bacterium]|nr:enoyl-CoA hydratase-related protein [Burkholderiales bacterium]